jgi:hypothetical protein
MAVNTSVGSGAETLIVRINVLLAIWYYVMTLMYGQVLAILHELLGTVLCFKVELLSDKAGYISPAQGMKYWH